ncbi:serine hydrolase domain-containing protein [Nonomuraea sp. NPDC050328]|uniref:serine hydrolase domain-containing protein n=1 Tax=Nonomuraea sp. NPDC050328 TaxID=3364361 RepID=UPI0037B09E6A
MLLEIKLALLLAVAPADPGAIREAIQGLPDETATAALVRVNGQTHTSGYADVTARTKVAKTTRFRIGSITKTFIAAAALQLVHEGALRLDDPVLTKDGKQITLRHLLTHTSGLSRASVRVDDPRWYLKHRFDTYTPAELLKPALAAPLDFEPGTRQQYNNADYMLAAQAIERATGRPYGQVITERVIEPLRLAATSVPGTASRLPEPYTRGYVRIGERLVDVTRQNPSVAWGSGEMISNAPDLDRFIRALFRGQVVKGAELAAMFTIPDVPAFGPGCPGPKACMGMGLQSATSGGITVWGHVGERPGYASGVFATKDLALRLVYLVNSTEWSPKGGSPAVVQKIYAAVGG